MYHYYYCCKRYYYYYSWIDISIFTDSNIHFARNIRCYYGHLAIFVDWNIAFSILYPLFFRTTISILHSTHVLTLWDSESTSVFRNSELLRVLVRKRSAPNMLKLVPKSVGQKAGTLMDREKFQSTRDWFAYSSRTAINNAVTLTCTWVENSKAIFTWCLLSLIIHCQRASREWVIIFESGSRLVKIWKPLCWNISNNNDYYNK